MLQRPRADSVPPAAVAAKLINELYRDLKRSDPIGKATKWAQQDRKRKMEKQLTKSKSSKLMKVSQRTGPGRSAGFLTAKNNYRGYKRRYVKKQHKKLTKSNVVSYQQEIGYIVQGSELVACGHSTHPVSYVMQSIAAAICKIIFQKHNWAIAGSVNAVLVGTFGGYSVGDVFQYGVENRETGVGASFVTWNTLAANTTVQDLINSLAAVLQDIYADGTTSLQSILFLPSTTTSGALGKDRLTLNFTGASVYVDAKSSLKVQNRTVLGTDVSIDDVDNQPIHGRMFESNGTYFQARKVGNGIDFCGTRLTGAIMWSSNRNTTNLDLREVPPPSYFTKTKAVGKVKLEPGEIKTSVLTSSVKASFDDLHKFVSKNVATSGLNSATEPGKCRMMVFEKMIDCEETASNLTLGVEIDYRISTKVVLKNNDYWPPINLNKVFNQ